MPIYTVISKATGQEVHRYMGDAPVEWQGMEFSAFDHLVYVEPVPVAPVAAPRTLTKLEWMNRFTDIELATIYTAAKQSIAVEIWLEKFRLSSEVNTGDQRTIDGVQALEVAGIIGVGRAQEILNA